MEEIKNFYSRLKFPGPYTIDDLKYYDSVLVNPYLKSYDDSVIGSKSVLDIGCGSGFIVNFLARRHPNVYFTAIDFSDSIDYAKAFSKKNNIKNVEYIKEDFLKWHPTHYYDCVISNGVLHHIPKYTVAVEKIKELAIQRLTVGLYNSFGKVAKRFFPVKYKNNILYSDQEECPFETSFNDSEARHLFEDEYSLISVYPSYKNDYVDWYGLWNYKKGGLTVYSWQKKD